LSSSELKAALQGVLYLDPIPKDMLDTISNIPSNDEDLSEKIAGFREVALHCKMLDMPDERQFFAAQALIGLYMNGMSHLELKLKEVGADMVDVLKDPAGNSPDEKAAQQQAAMGVIAQLGLLGINIEGVNFHL
jgi:hypothetical protein